MLTGIAVIELHVHESQSLKAKRGVVRSISARLRNRFNVSVAEVGGQGTWQAATLGLAMVGHDEPSLRRALSRAIDFVEATALAQVLESDIQILPSPLESGEGGLPEDDEAPWATNLRTGAE